MGITHVLHLKDMSKNRIDSKYDAVIIGAGISGLVCGCYLAKAGMKVLIVEKNDKVGGYCSCIKKDNYKFNLTTSMLGGTRKAGTLDKIFYKELNLEKNPLFKKEKYSNTVVMKDGIFDFCSSKQELFSNLIRLFPSEEDGIKSFLQLALSESSLSLYLKYKNMTFGKLLDSLFIQNKTKDFFTIVCGIFGFSPRKLSAFSAIIYYRETIFNDGCYICGGAENLPKILSEEFENNNGRLLLETRADRIDINKTYNTIEAVIIKNNKRINTDYLIACCDAKEIFLNLIGEDRLNGNFTGLIRNMSITSSVLIAYLGLKKPIQEEARQYKSRNIWFCPTYNVEKTFYNIENKNYNGEINYFLCFLSSSKDTSSIDQITLYTHVPFMNGEYWQKNTKAISEQLIKKAENVINGISGNIRLKFIITPNDLFNYTFNFNGAIKGWASIPNQNNPKIIPQGKIFSNLYIAGQWSLLEPGQGGIPMTSFSGRRAAKMILKYNTQKRGAK